MASLSLRDDFAATFELYSIFIKQMKTENPQVNVSDVSFARGKAGKNSYGKRHPNGISNASNAAVDDRLFEKHEYNALAPYQKNTLRLNLLKRGHVGKSHTGTGKKMARTMRKLSPPSHLPIP
jgi:superfamily II DNA/RNA helicase